MNNAIQSKQKEHGQSMVELALTITILMALLAGTIDLGRAFFTWLTMRDAAQEGASYGSIEPTDTGGIINRAELSFQDVITDADADVDINVSFSGPQCLGSTPSTITVQIEYNNFTLTMPFLGTILGSQTIPIRATVNDTILMPLCTP